MRITAEAIEFTAAEARRLTRWLSATAVTALLLLLLGVALTFTPEASAGRVLAGGCLAVSVLGAAALLVLRLSAASPLRPR